MKKYFIILFMLFISSSVLAQWSGEINLSQFTLPSQCKLNACVDANGIHLVYQHNGGIKYARSNYNGSTVYYYDRVIESEGSNCDFVNIVSVNNNYLYAIYKKNNTINIKRSVNLGSSWSQYSYRPMTNSGCDKIVAYNDAGDIHIGWTENSNGYLNSYYIKFTPLPSPAWSYYKEVTDQEYDGGYDPDLAISPGKVHYTYLIPGDDPKSRDKVKTSTNWDSPMYMPIQGSSSQYTKPVIANNEINVACRVFYSFFNGDGAYISNSDRPFNQGFWNDNVWLRESEPGEETEVEATTDNKIHFIYYDKTDNKWEHRYLSNSTLSGQIGEVPLVDKPYSTLIANSNDLYLLALSSIDTPAWIKLQHYDAAPSPPQNLSITKSGNNHPLLQWTANTELDMNNYQVWKKGGDEGGDWHIKTTTTNTTYEDPDEIVLTGPKQANESLAYYKLKAVDLGSNPSDFSDEVNIRVGIEPPSKISVGNSLGENYSYQLYQNYPNPFNPITQISYSIKAEGTVTLKVYDMLGKEVANLVNERKEPGNYSVTFNAADLPSGIYVYKLTANDFTATKKLMLVK
jgi:hypothetical protein